MAKRKSSRRGKTPKHFKKFIERTKECWRKLRAGELPAKTGRNSYKGCLTKRAR